MKNTENTNWEAELRERSFDYKLAEYPSLVPKQLVKDFIRETHRTLLTELIAEVEEMKENFNHIAPHDYYLGVRDGAEEALSDLKSLLENKRDGYDR